jgi:hypothetical protein
MFEDEEAKSEREAMAAEGAEFLDSLNNHLRAQKVLFICVLVELLLFALVFFFPKTFSNLPFGNIILLAFILFILGFLIANTAYRLLFPGDQQDKPVRSGIMSGYEYSSNQNNKWFIWMISAAAGVLNIFISLAVLELAFRLK